jgi:hypothetical protein
MLQDKVLNVPVWLWIIIVAYIVINIYYTCKLTQEKFSQSKIKVYNFNTSWCGWSKRFQPEWDKFCDLCKDMPHIEVYDVKCDKEENKEQCKKFNIPGYPTVIAQVGDNKVHFEGDRKAERLIEFIKTL